MTQDVVDLPEHTTWERMNNEYRTMGLYPSGHVMEQIRKKLEQKVATSLEVANLEDGAPVAVAGLVIRRQRPLAKAVFITLEDEFGHTPLIIWPKVYERYRQVLKEPLLLAEGTVSRREGTMNVVMSQARAISSMEEAPKAKNWR